MVVTTDNPKVRRADRRKLNRSTLATSRLMDFCSEKELTAQTGHQVRDWPLVILKELLDNGLDACEEAGVQPEIDVAVTPDAITVTEKRLQQSPAMSWDEAVAAIVGERT